jgi:hypothetical protein
LDIGELRMAIFKFKQVVYDNYEIEAETQEEALEKLYSGNYDPVSSDYNEVVFSDEG